MAGFLLMLAAALPLVADAKTERKKLEGTWTVVEIDRGGRKVSQATLKKRKPTITFAGTRYKVALDGKTMEEGTFQVDPSKKPATLDLQIKSGDSRGKTQRGYYELKEGTLKTWMAEPGKARPRKANAGALVELTILKRQKD